MKNRVLKTFVLMVVLSIVGVAGWGAYIVVHYLGTSPRFEVRKISVKGQERAALSQVLAQADLPDKANVFTADLTGVRERVEALQIVRFATVARVLPDTIAIRIVERQPVGLARIHGAILQFDSDGELLERDEGAGLDSPVLDGLDPEDREGNRKKVDLYLRIMEDLHGQSELSQIRIDDSGEVSVVSLNEPMLVNLGKSEFRQRWGLYLELRTQIQNQFPEAVQVDLRFSKPILKFRQDAPDEEKVVWDAEKKSL